MGWFKGPVSFRRFRVGLDKPRLFDAGHLDRLRAFKAAIRGEPPGPGGGEGWAGGAHVLDAEFSELKNVFPDHLVWDFWTRTDKPPPELFKAYYETELKALAADNPGGYPSNRQRREARESARDRLEQEAKDGRFAKWKTVPCAWDGGRNEVWFGSPSGRAAERFCRRFARTFDPRPDPRPDGPPPDLLTPVTAGTLAAAIDPRAADESLSKFVPGVTPDEAAWCPAGGPPDFLGNEFLLWLWHVADEQDGDTVPTPDGGEVTFMFSGGVKFDCPSGQTGNDTINHASGVRTPEARAARATGLTAVRHDEQYAFVLQAETLAVTSGKLPAADGQVAGRDRDAARLGAVRDLAELTDQLFAAFVHRRLSPGWADELRRVQRWAARPAVGV